MKIKTSKSSSGFTLIELLVVIGTIAALAALAVPALKSALSKAQMTGTMNNARQLYLSQLSMANDGAATADPTLAWPGDRLPAPTSLQDTINNIVEAGYLRAGDIVRLCSAPSCSLAVNVVPGPPESVTFTAGTKSALKVYKVQDVDTANTIFAASRNFIYNKDLVATDVPYGTKGFVIIHKGGDGVVYKSGQATTAGWGGDCTKYQNNVGQLTGDPINTCSPDDNNKAWIF